MELHQKKSRYSFSNHPLTIFFSLGLLVLFAILFRGIIVKYLQIRKAHTLSETNYNQSKERLKTLRAEIDELNSSWGREQKLREAYRALKDGEESIIIVNPDSKNTPEIQTQ